MSALIMYLNKKKILAGSVTVIAIVIAFVFFVRTYITAAVFVPETAIVDVTSTDFVPINIDTGARVIVNGSAAEIVATATPVVQAKKIQKPPADYPARMIIKTLNIDAKVQNTGITKRGSIGTPNNFTDVAWYVYGPIPGRRGVAIFDGHVDNGLGLPGVFKDLGSIKVGDDIEVVTNGGKSIYFKVSALDSYDYNSVPVGAMFDDSGPSKIVLISCEGNWVGSEKTYDKRLVVTAVLVE